MRPVKDGLPPTAGLRHGGTNPAEPPSESLRLQPVVDLRGSTHRLAGYSCSLAVDAIAGRDSSLRAVRALREAVAAADDLDVFVVLQGVTGAAAAAALPAILNGAEEAGVALTRLVVDVGGPFSGPLAGSDILETIESTRGRGIRVSISRAGLSETGLEMLLGMRPDFLRIAATLVSGCGGDFYRQAIVETISGLSWKFGASVLAEGVLDERDAHWLSFAGVSFGLGPYFGEPVGHAGLHARSGRQTPIFDPSPATADDRSESPVPPQPRTSQEEP